MPPQKETESGESDVILSIDLLQESDKNLKMACLDDSMEETASTVDDPSLYSCNSKRLSPQLELLRDVENNTSYPSQIKRLFRRSNTQSVDPSIDEIEALRLKTRELSLLNVRLEAENNLMNEMQEKIDSLTSQNEKLRALRNTDHQKVAPLHEIVGAMSKIQTDIEKLSDQNEEIRARRDSMQNQELQSSMRRPSLATTASRTSFRQSVGSLVSGATKRMRDKRRNSSITMEDSQSSTDNFLSPTKTSLSEKYGSETLSPESTGSLGGSDSEAAEEALNKVVQKMKSYIELLEEEKQACDSQCEKQAKTIMELHADVESKSAKMKIMSDTFQAEKRFAQDEITKKDDIIASLQEELGLKTAKVEMLQAFIKSNIE